jgi:hypothetical protein
MVQHIRKKHPEYAQLPNTIHTPLTTAVISATPAVLTTDSATGETVVVSGRLGRVSYSFSAPPLFTTRPCQLSINILPIGLLTLSLLLAASSIVLMLGSPCRCHLYLPAKGGAGHFFFFFFFFLLYVSTL